MQYITTYVVSLRVICCVRYSDKCYNLNVNFCIKFSPEGDYWEGLCFSPDTKLRVITLKSSAKIYSTLPYILVGLEALF